MAQPSKLVYIAKNLTDLKKKKVNQSMSSS